MQRMALILFLLIVSQFSSLAQVIDVKEVPFPSLRVEQRLDLNGDTCAVVKIETSDNNMEFGGNVIGNPIFRENAMYVYLTAGTKQLKVKPSKSSSFMVYFDKFGIKKLRANIAYLMTVPSGNKAIGEEFELDKSFKPYKLVSLEDSMSFENLKRLADQGNTEAQASVAKCYYKGFLVDRSTKGFLAYAPIAAAKGNAIAQNLMGTACYEGFAVRKDLKKAVEWYQKSADQDYPMAICNLGSMYQKGEGVVKNVEMALLLFKKALALGWAHACADLYLYYSEDGVEPNLKKAVGYLRKGVSYGSSICLAQLGLNYAECNDGVDKADYVKAFKLYQMAAAQNDVDGMSLLGACYYNGEGTTKDYSKAFYWLRMAAEHDHAYSQFLVGCCFLEGNGVAQSNEDAKYWFQKALDNGFEDAKEIIQEMK